MDEDAKKSADIYIEYLKDEIMKLVELHNEMLIRDLNFALTPELTFVEVIKERETKESNYSNIMESKRRELKERKDKYGHREGNN